MQHVGNGVYRHIVPVERSAEAIANFIVRHPEIEIVSLCCIPYGYYDLRKRKSLIERFKKGPLMTPSTAELIIVTRPVHAV